MDINLLFPERPHNKSVLFLGVVLIVLAWDLFALVVIKRSKTPKFAKFLSMSLIIFESIIMILPVFMYFDNYGLVGRSVFVIVRVTVYALVYTTIGMMGIDRLYMVKRPLRYYLEFIGTSRKRLYAVLIWLAVVILFTVISIIICVTPVIDINNCGQYLLAVHFIYYFAVIVLSIGCYAVVYRSLIRHKRKLLQSKTTSLLLCYFIPTVFSMIFMTVTLITGKESFLSAEMYTFAVDVILLLHCVADPLLYVFWFKDCQVTMFTVVSFCIPPLRKWEGKTGRAYSRVKRQYLNNNGIVVNNSPRRTVVDVSIRLRFDVIETPCTLEGGAVNRHQNSARCGMNITPKA